jgi:hypothetical protein
MRSATGRRTLVFVMRSRRDAIELLPCYRGRARLLHPRARRHGADGVRRARVDAGGEAQGDHGYDRARLGGAGKNAPTGTP